jgi:hypothetical protein
VHGGRSEYSGIVWLIHRMWQRVDASLLVRDHESVVHARHELM